MDNSKILSCLVKQRDDVFNRLNATTISGLYQEMHDDIQDGKLIITVNDEKLTPINLRLLCMEKSHDHLLKAKVNTYTQLDSNSLIEHFKGEFVKVFDEIVASGKADEIQAMFIEYDAYYFYEGCIYCYGLQDYPIVVEPRYISGEYDYNKKVMSLTNKIDFRPAWPDCEEFSDFIYLDVEFKLQDLFQLHSRTLLHKAIDSLNEERKLGFIKNRPFTIYVNENDCEVMTLYRLG